jgi:pSer/pThr/pTyr-binding forkhead associated (FHA) protein
MHITVKLLDGEILEFPFEGKSATIGRSPRCEIVIPHDGVSRQHCRIDLENGEFFVTDLASTNGVMIDGNKILPNKKTVFQTFLPLSFGPVQSLTVLEEAPAGFTTSLSGVTISETLAGNKQIKEKIAALKSSAQTKPIQEAKKKETGIDLKMVLATFLAVGIMVFAYYLHQMQTPEESISPQKSQPSPVEYY